MKRPSHESGTPILPVDHRDPSHLNNPPRNKFSGCALPRWLRSKSKATYLSNSSTLMHYAPTLSMISQHGSFESRNSLAPRLEKFPIFKETKICSKSCGFLSACVHTTFRVINLTFFQGCNKLQAHLNIFRGNKDQTCYPLLV